MGEGKRKAKSITLCFFLVFGLACQGNDIVFRFIIEYSSLRDFYRPLGNNIIGLFLYEDFLKGDILACVET
jgi:hypothetical protein